MISINSIKKEHELIERELVELETIMDEENINFPNLVHIFAKLHSLWDSHEKKEEDLFNKFKADGIDFPVDEILFAHKELRGHKKVIENAINSGSEFEMQVSLDTDGKIIINKLREHIKKEEIYLDKVSHPNL
jgi:hypothetical protein